MYIYFIEYAILLLSALFISRATSSAYKRNQGITLCFSIVLFLILALRHQSLGVDLAYRTEYGYLGSFERIGSLSIGELFNLKSWQNYEPGFIFYNWLVYQLCPSRQFYIALSAALSLFPVIYIINKYSKNTFLAFIIYAALPSYMMLFSGIRQGMAIGICFYATLFIVNKNLYKFLGFVYLATLFHYSAFIFALAYPLYHINFSIQTKRYLSILFPILYIFKNPIFLILFLLFKDDTKIENTGAFMLMAFFILLYIYMVFYKTENKYNDNFITLFYIACCISIFSGIHNLANRVGFYFMPYLAICLPNMTDSISNKKEKLTMQIIFSILFIYLGIKSLTSTAMTRCSEYLFFWDI